MKKRRITALLMSAVMAVSMMGGMSLTAFAADPAANTDAVQDLKTILGESTAITDTDTNGSLKLYMKNGDDQLTADQSAGAEFSAYPLVTYTMTDDAEISGYELANPDFWGTMGVTSIRDLQDGLQVGTITNTSIAGALREFTGTLTASATATVAAGENFASFDPLDFAFYYVKQTEAAAGGMVSSAPILVSLPFSVTTTPDDGGDAVTTWYSKLTAYAKTSLPTVTKQILDKKDTAVVPGDATDPTEAEGTWEKETSQSAATKVYFRVEMDFPSYTLTGLTEDEISAILVAMTDRMPDNLAWDKDSVSVKCLAKGSTTENTIGDNLYTVYDADTADTTHDDFPTDAGYNTTDKTFMVDFTGHYAAIAGLADVEKLVVYYTATVTEKIAVGAGETNTVDYTYTNDADSITVGAGSDKPHGTTTSQEDTTVLWTFGTTIDKYRKGTPTVKLEGAAFTVADTTDQANSYWFVKNGEDTYAVAAVGTPATGTMKYYTDASFATEAAAGTETAFIKYEDFELSDKTTADIFNLVRTGASGKIQVSGMDEGTYTLTEVEAPAGYNKLTAPITLTITAVKDAENKLTGKVDDAAMTPGAADNGDGFTDIGVENSNGIELPATGGLGTILFTLAGLVILLGCVAAVVSARAKKKYSQE